MVYRKGERPLARAVVVWSADHPIACAIADGDGWVDAWIRQQGTPLAKLTKQSGIASDRLWQMIEGGTVTRAELAALARAWHTTPDDLAASIPNQALIID